MLQPLHWNTLEESADYLVQQTQEPWTPRRVIDAALRLAPMRPNHFPLPVFVEAAPPRDTRFFLYRWDTEKGTPSNPFVRQGAVRWQTVPLFQVHLGEILQCGETEVGIAQRPDDTYGQDGDYVFIEPPLTVNVAMLGMSRQALEMLAACLLAESARDALPSNAPAEKQDDEWIIEARELANDIWLRILNLGKKPTKEGIAPEIARRLRKLGRQTKNGKPITPEYIVRAALGNGWKPPVPD